MSDPELIVIGAGPAGLAAAITAAQAGVKVVIMEQSHRAGGRMGLQPQKMQGPRTIFRDRAGFQLRDDLLKEAQKLGVNLMLETCVSALSREPDVHFTRHGVAGRYQTRAVIVATGSRPKSITFPGCDLLGVMAADEAQETLNLKGKLPGHRILMLGSDNDGLLISQNLTLAGAHVVAVVEWRSVVIGQESNVAPLKKAGTSLYTGSMVVKATGGPRVTSAVIARVDTRGAAIPGTELVVETDTICIAAPRTPASDLASMAGCPLVCLDILGGLTPVHDSNMATPVPGVYVCGDAAGVENGAIALQKGYLAGLSALGGLGYSHPKGELLERACRKRLAYLRRGYWGRLRSKAQAYLKREYVRLTENRGAC